MANTRRRNSKFAQYPTEGSMDFSVCGYAQKVTEGDNVDYVVFNIDNPFVQGNVNCITVEVPWNDDLPMIEEGQKVNIFGLIRSWWKEDLGRVINTFVAQQAEIVQDEQPKRGRRGIAKNPTEE